MRKQRFNDNLLFAGAKANRVFTKKQIQMRKRHHIEDDRVLVVEKSNMVKFLIGLMGQVIRTAAIIALLAFSAIGMTSLLYPGPRRELAVIGSEIIRQVKNFF